MNLKYKSLFLFFLFHGKYFIQHPSDIHDIETMPKSTFSFLTSKREGSFGSIVIKEV